MIQTTSDQPLNITNDKFVDYGLKWSHDGNFILFAKQVNKQYDFYIYNVALKTTEQLTNDTIDQNGPSFSPDGKRILFVSNADHRQYEVYLMNLTTKNMTRITRVAENSDIWLMDKNGDNKKQYVTSSKRDEILEFKPTKKRKN